MKTLVLIVIMWTDLDGHRWKWEAIDPVSQVTCTATGALAFEAGRAQGWTDVEYRCVATGAPEVSLRPKMKPQEVK